MIGWMEFSLISGILVLVYFLVGSLYAGGVARDMARRITFSESSARVGQGLFMMALALVVAGSIYAGYSAHIEREGFTDPSPVGRWTCYLQSRHRKMVCCSSTLVRPMCSSS